MDPSMSAIQAGDYTLAVQSCDSVIAPGFSVCRVKDGALVDSVWTIVLPHGDKMLGGEVQLDYRDITRPYGVTKDQRTLEIPFRDIIQRDIWRREDQGTVLVRAKLRFKGNTGEETIQARALSFLVVTDAGYDPLPMDSGFAGFKTKCEVNYTTAGRAAVACK